MLLHKLGKVSLVLFIAPCTLQFGYASVQLIANVLDLDKSPSSLVLIHMLLVGLGKTRPLTHQPVYPVLLLMHLLLLLKQFGLLASKLC